MQWITELDDDWDDVPSEPPTVMGAELEMNWVGDGFVLGPEPAGSAESPER